MGPKGVPSCLVRFPNSWYTRGSGNLTIPFPASFSQRRSVTRFKPAPGITTVLITAVVLMCPTKIPSGS